MEQIEILCLASGSTGNCYALRKHNQVVLIECGIEYDLICSKLITQGIAPSEIVACLITHRHKDHSLSVLELMKRGVKVYTDYIIGGGVEDGAKLLITDWLKVLCFKVEHDVNAYGFALLDLETKDTILFINDTGEFSFPEKLRGVPFDIIMIECNYIQTQLNAIRMANSRQSFKYNRQEEYHLSLLGTKHMLNQVNLKKTKMIVLMHLSMDCANETQMKEEIQQVYNIRTLVAKRNGGLN